MALFKKKDKDKDEDIEKKDLKAEEEKLDAEDKTESEDVDKKSDDLENDAPNGEEVDKEEDAVDKQTAEDIDGIEPREDGDGSEIAKAEPVAEPEEKVSDFKEEVMKMFEALNAKIDGLVVKRAEPEKRAFGLSEQSKEYDAVSDKRETSDDLFKRYFPRK